jgi:hypothetical protein
MSIENADTIEASECCDWEYGIDDFLVIHAAKAVRAC